MPSFDIADCPTSLPLAVTQEGTGRVQKGTLTLTVRNRTDRLRGARVGLELPAGARPEWFAFEGAAATSPRALEQDFQPKGTATVRLNLRIPEGEPAGRHRFKLRVTSEDDPDNDFADGPEVAFEIATAPPAPAPKREGVPLWLILLGVGLVLVAGGVGAYLFFSGKRVPAIVGMTWTDAEQKLRDADIGYQIEGRIILNRGSRFWNRVLIVEPDEGARVPGGGVRVYIEAGRDPLFNPTINKPLDSFPQVIREKAERGASITAMRYFGIVGPNPPP